MTGSSQPLNFRAATAADIDAICVLWDVSGLGGGRSVDEAEILERLESNDGFFVVGELADHEGLVAVAMGCYDNHRGWMKRVAVHPEHRGSGAGRSIVEEVERRFRSAGITKLRLAVWSDNAAALGFWADLDYEELTAIRYFQKEL